MSKDTPVKKQAESKAKPAPVPKTDPKPSPAQQQNLGLPEGSVFQQTGHRRPLIVFPK